MKIETFDDVQTFLDSLGLHTMDLSLARMHQAIAALGLKSFSCKVVQVVGTNGKGSTATFLSSLAQAHGLRVGLYTSPHFVTPRERIRINGDMLSSDVWVHCTKQIIATSIGLTYFEFLTIIALYVFIDKGVDLIVLEAGLGGQYDATTAIARDLVCYTSISLDHECILGPTISDIAFEKAQAMETVSCAITGSQSFSVMKILEEEASKKNCSLHRSDKIALSYEEIETMIFKRTPSVVTLRMAGVYQWANAHLALAAWRIVSREYGWGFSLDNIIQGVSSGYISGRFQYVAANDTLGCPYTLLDGAHNPDGLEKFFNALKAEKITPSAVIFSCFSDKNVTEMVPLVQKIANGAVIITPTIQSHERAIDGEVLANLFAPCAIYQQRLSLALKYIKRSCIQSSKEHPVVIIGSLYLLGEFFTLYPNSLK